jgi:hypothetical protein
MVATWMSRIAKVRPWDYKVCASTALRRHTVVKEVRESKARKTNGSEDSVYNLEFEFEVKQATPSYKSR